MSIVSCTQFPKFSFMISRARASIPISSFSCVSANLGARAQDVGTDIAGREVRGVRSFILAVFTAEACWSAQEGCTCARGQAFHPRRVSPMSVTLLSIHF